MSVYDYYETSIDTSAEGEFNDERSRVRERYLGDIRDFGIRDYPHDPRGRDTAKS